VKEHSVGAAEGYLAVAMIHSRKILLIAIESKGIQLQIHEQPQLTDYLY
jgi:hypothetical protein